jgi:EmrB/QacA subfamily drug resistance transporter
MRYSTTAGRWVILATVLGSGMASIDATVVGIALPSIGRQFHASVGTLEWVVTGYTLTLGALLLFGGSLGDRYGRRLVFTVGVVWFSLASAVCAVAPDTTVLILTRALQGVGAALLTPGSLAIIEASFDPADRGQAIGAWSGLGGIATAAGPLIGGYLIVAASWRWIFLINIPVGAVVLAATVRHVPESRDPDVPRRVDAAGAICTTVALAGIAYGLIEGPSIGWSSPSVVVMLAAGVAAITAFVVVERSTPAPMLPLSMFRARRFTATNAVTFVVYAALGGALFLVPVELQIVDRYSPLESGVALLPLTGVMLLLSARSGRLASRIGPRLQMTVGPILVGVGLALLTRATSDATYASGVLPAVVVFGLGLAVTVAPLTSTAMSALPDEQAGVASAVNNDVARVGSLIAVAVLPALAGISGASYLDPAKLSVGFRTALFIAAACSAAGGGIAAVGIRNPAPRPGPTGARRGPAHEECFHCALDAPSLPKR